MFGRASGFDDLYLAELGGASQPTLASKGIVALDGEEASQQFGKSLRAAGDVDGDGLADLLIGDNNDKAFLILGKSLGDKKSGAKATADDPNIAGTSAANEFLQGSADDNAITAIGTGDVAYGGGGDDEFSIDAIDFKRIDGGSGRDTLILNAGGVTLDLSDTARSSALLSNIETIDLTGTGNNKLVLDRYTVQNLSGAPGQHARLIVKGNSGDVVELVGGRWAAAADETIDGTSYKVHTDGVARVLIEDGVTIIDGNESPMPTDATPIVLEALGGQGFANFVFKAADYFEDDDKAENLGLDILGFDTLTNTHGLSAVALTESAGTYTVAVSGELAANTPDGTELTLTLEATDLAGAKGTRELVLKAVAPTETSVTIDDAKLNLRAVGDFDGDGFADLMRIKGDEGAVTLIRGDSVLAPTYRHNTEHDQSELAGAISFGESATSTPMGAPTWFS